MAAFEITGGIDPLLAVTLEKGEAILAESNAMVAMDTALSLKERPAAASWARSPASS